MGKQFCKHCQLCKDRGLDIEGCRVLDTPAPMTKELLTQAYYKWANTDGGGDREEHAVLFALHLQKEK